MSQADSLHGRYRLFVSELTGALDANDEAAFRVAFERLRAEVNVELNPELKRLTETAQSSLRRFRERARLDALANQEVSDARKRLTHAVQLTGEAAQRTLDLIEQSGPLVDQLTRDATQLVHEWNTRGSRAKVTESLWPERVHDFLGRIVGDSRQLRQILSQMLQAQCFQDLTGQIIQGVNEFAGDLEAVLAQLVALTNGEDTRRMPMLRPAGADGAWRRAAGPRVPGVDDANSVNGQDDIDALLANVAGGE